ncbi:hypothetical protein GC176_01670 [bacterium]|nr:hypothetical protein [bacterium]
MSEEVARLREEVEAAIKAAPEAVVAETWNEIGSRNAEVGDDNANAISDFRVPTSEFDHLVKKLCRETSASHHAARQVVEYVAAQIAAVGVVPTQKRVIFERFFDETGGMQMVVHAPFGSRITHAWGLAMRKRFCVSFDFELQATADDEGFILSLGPQHSFPLESMFPMLNRDNVRELLKQAILYIPMFQIRWRWNMNRALLVPRRDKGKRIPPALQRFRADDLLTSVFPMLTGCQENISGPLELPDHILLRQTMEDCLTEALDIEGLEDVLGRVGSGEIEFIARDTREPSPFSYELLNSNPYAFLDGGEIAERRARAVATRRSLSVESASDLGRLDPLAIEQVVNEAQPLIRSADELHDLLLTRLIVREDELLETVENAHRWLGELAGQRRTTRVYVSPESGTSLRDVSLADSAERSATLEERLLADDGRVFWAPAERLPAVLAMFPDAKLDPPIEAPEGVRLDWNNVEARVAAVRGLIETCGPITHIEAAERVGLSPEQTFACLEALEGEGLVLRGRFRPKGQIAGATAGLSGSVSFEWQSIGHQVSGTEQALLGKPAVAPANDQAARQGGPDDTVEWCHRRLLSRIHRLTLDGLRKQIQPVTIETFFRFLIRHHGLTSDSRRAGVNGLFETISILQGLDIPAACWERDILPARLSGYRSEWLDELCLGGEVAWGRLFPPKRESESRSGVTRVVPVSIFLRSDQDWLTAASPLSDDVALTATAQATVELLASSGATFASDLQQRLGLTGGTFQDVLGELLTAGVLTADGFGGLRSLLAEKGNTTSSLSRRRGLVRRRAASGTVGRWSLWRYPSVSRLDQAQRRSCDSELTNTSNAGPAPHSRPDADEPLTCGDVVEQWAWQLLRRWGVVFRELLDREAGAPRWWELLQIYRRLEARGELRGGRFISGVAGEQFALPDTVKRLRDLRDESPPNRAKLESPKSSSARIRDDFLATLDTNGAKDSAEPPNSSVNNAATSDWVVLSAADPLNLIGVITEHARVPAFAHNRIAFHCGRPVAALVNQDVVLLERLSLAMRDRVAALLATAGTGEVTEMSLIGALDHARSDEPTGNSNETNQSDRRKFVRPVIS